MSHERQPLIFGEVLFDCFPDGARVLGGAPFNVAWHCQGFGLEPVFISRLGDDDNGRSILSAMQDWGMSTAGMQLDNKHATGIVDVSFIEQEPQYTIVENSAWDFIDAPAIESEAPLILYHGSLALRNDVSRVALQQIKQQHQGAIFVDINLRLPWWTADIIDYALNGCSHLKLNEHELELIVKQAGDTAQHVQFLFDQYPLELLILTQGEQGAKAYTRNGDVLSVTPQRSDSVIDTVGAGDAFSSVILLGLCRGWSLDESLQRAQQFASRVVGIRGATSRDQVFYRSLSSEWC